VLDTTRRVATPEGIELTLRLAGPVPRAIPAAEAGQRLRTREVQRRRAELTRHTPGRRLVLTGEMLSLHLLIPKGAPTPSRVSDAVCALARSIEKASIHDVDGEGAPDGSPIAVRALGE
jgi:hypothetical protein